MPRVTRIDRADAFKAIESILLRGEAPTHINVRAELGQRGSPPVISNFISSWFAVYGPTLAGRTAQESVPVTAPAASSGLEGGAIAALTAAALEQIQQAASEREVEHSRQREADRRALEDQRVELEKSIAAFALQQQAHAEHVERAYLDRDNALKERDLALGDAAGLRLSLASLKSQLQALEEKKDLLARLEQRLEQALSFTSK